MAYKENKLKLSTEQFLQKIENWCIYQERSQDQTRRKLREWGATEEEADAILSAVIENNFINEERFAQTFAGGKFRLKNWGRIKIRAELRKHKVSEPNIDHALGSLDENEYQKTLIRLIEKKITTTAHKNKIQVKASVFSYLAGKGFEADLISDCLNNYFNTHHEFRS